jgi:hypothetical protein
MCASHVKGRGNRAVLSDTNSAVDFLFHLERLEIRLYFIVVNEHANAN